MSFLIAFSAPNYAFVAAERRVSHFRIAAGGVEPKPFKFSEGPRKVYRFGDGFVGFIGVGEIVAKLIRHVAANGDPDSIPPFCEQILKEPVEQPPATMTIVALLRPGFLWSCNFKDGKYRSETGNPCGGYVLGWPGIALDQQAAVEKDFIRGSFFTLADGLLAAAETFRAVRKLTEEISDDFDVGGFTTIEDRLVYFQYETGLDELATPAMTRAFLRRHGL